MSASRLAGLALCACLCVEGGERRWEVRVPRMDRPLAQLAHARRLKQAIHRRAEEDQAFWRSLAVEAYQAVRHYHPGAREIGAEASFRAGELLRAGGDPEAAQSEFRQAEELGRGTPFRARARLEIAHLQRRAGDARAALEEYLGVAGDPSAEQQHRDEAWLWAGRTWQAEGRIDDARRAWKGVAEGEGHPLDRLQAFDELGLSWIDAGDLEQARASVAACLAALEPAAAEESELGCRTRSALHLMRTRALLERAGESDEARGP